MKQFAILSLILLCACTVQKRRYQRGFYVNWHNSYPQKQSKATAARTPQAHPVAEKVEALPQKKNRAAEKEQQLFVSTVKKLLVQDVKTTLGFAAPPTDTCDVLIFKDGSEVRSRIQDVNVIDVRYKRCDNMDGPVYSCKKSDLFMIKYANGTREVIHTETPQQQTQTPRQRVPGPQNNRYNTGAKYQRSTHPLAVVALITGILSILFGYIGLIALGIGLGSGALFVLALIAGIAAVITGKIALRHIREEPDVYKGKGLAIPGYIMGLVIVCLSALFLFILASAGLI